MINLGHSGLWRKLEWLDVATCKDVMQGYYASEYLTYML